MFNDDSERRDESVPETPQRLPLLPWPLDKEQNEPSQGASRWTTAGTHADKTAPGPRLERPPLVSWPSGEQGEPASATSSVYSQDSDKFVSELPPRLPPLPRLSYEQGESDPEADLMSLPVMPERGSEISLEEERPSPAEIPNTPPTRRGAIILESIDEDPGEDEGIGESIHDLASTLSLPSSKDRVEPVPLPEGESDDEDQPEKEVVNDTSPDPPEKAVGEIPAPIVNAESPEQTQEQTHEPEPDEPAFMTGTPLIFIMIGLMLGMLIISMDRTIISTAIPFITHQFQSTPDIGWYGSAYLLTACAFQPVFGRIFMLYSAKKAYLAALFLFEIGSLVCALATSSLMLILGRAVAGFGSAGITTGSFIIVSTTVPLQARPIFMAVVGLMFGAGATAGPLLGGVFTDLVSWRWCFYVNLPVGAATAVVMALWFHPKANKHFHRGIVERLLDLDLWGNVLLLGSSIMLFLALEFTTQGTPWRSAEVIGLLVGFGVTAILFIAWQGFMKEEALMPPRIMLQRTVAASCGMALMTYAALINLTFFLPVWFQAVRGVSAMQSGVNMIPYFVVNGAFTLGAGFFVSAIGYTTPPAVIGCAVGTIGLGLMTTLQIDTTTAQWAGYQVITSAGFGMAIQQGFTAVQTVLEDDDLAVGTTAVVAAQSLGGALFLSVGNSIFQNCLLKATAEHVLDDIDVKKLIDGGAASFRELVSTKDLPLMLEVYNKALATVFTISIPLGVLSALISCFIEWKSVKKAKAVSGEVEKGGEKAGESGAGEEMVEVASVGAGTSPNAEAGQGDTNTA